MLIFPWRHLILLAGLLFQFTSYAAPITPYLEMVKISAVNSAWKSIPLSNSYTSPVIACTYNLPSASSNEAVVRVREVGSTLQVRIQRPLNSTAVTASDVYCTISEEGSYTYPIKYEAHRVTSTQTNYGSNWSATRMVNVSSSPFKVQSYTQPVVIGQVMSHNNANFSVFWNNNCSGRGAPPTNTAICVGKHTGQSVPTSPTTETLGYFIAEQAAYTLASGYLNIALGGNSVAGTGNSPPYNYSLPRNYSLATASQAAENGGNGGWAVLYGTSPVNTQLGLAVEEETVAGDTTRRHINEQVAYWVFEPITQTHANLKLNEILYREGGTIEEFVELAVLSSGTIVNYVVSSQDGATSPNTFLLPDITVATGDYIVLHYGSGTNSSSGGVHHVYTGVAADVYRRQGDDVVLLKPSSSDVTTLAGSGSYIAQPVDYVSWGSGFDVDPIPVSLGGVTVSWNTADNNQLRNAAVGRSISLTPNATDSDTSVCWEHTASGDAGTCPGYLATIDTDTSGYINSAGQSNTNAPLITLTKSVSTEYDPYNGASNPKAIPGSVLEYTVTAVNNGTAAAETIKITDSVPANTKLCVTTSGHCLAPYFVNGTPSSGLVFSSNEYSSDNGSSYSTSASPDADGADASVTDLRVNLTGNFLPKTGATGPNFQVRFRVVVE